MAIIACKCQHVFQDERYGKGNRVHNKTLKYKGTSDPGWRCTVCGDTKPFETKKVSS